MFNNDERGSGRKVRVRVSWLSPTVWLVKWAGGLVCKLEKTKTGLIRVRSIYFSAANQSKMQASIDRLHAQSFEFRAERRDSVYCSSGNQEYRISGKVGMMQKIESFVLTGFLQKQAGKVIPLGDRVQQVFSVNGRTVSIA